MAKAVLTTRNHSGYDDNPEKKYHFPILYLSRMKQVIGDYVIYYEPRREGGSLSYFATARIDRIIEDTQRSDHYYAIVSEYIGFDNKVGLRDHGGIEKSLFNSAGGMTGNARSAVRIIPEDEFDEIVYRGMNERRPWPDADEDLSHFGESAQEPYRRPMIESLNSRPFRDRKFRYQVQMAYNRTCALSHLRILNGLGRPEVQAAHIVPVSHGGNDSVRNGIALSSTLHWMFDKGLITISENYQILISRHLNYDISNILDPSKTPKLPEDISIWPAPPYLQYHRENIFKH